MSLNLHGLLLLLLNSILCNCTAASFLTAKLHNCTKRPKLLAYTVSAIRPPGLLLLRLQVELLHGLQPAWLALTLKLHSLQLHSCLAFCLPNYTTAKNGLSCTAACKQHFLNMHPGTSAPAASAAPAATAARAATCIGSCYKTTAHLSDDCDSATTCPCNSSLITTYTAPLQLPVSALLHCTYQQTASTSLHTPATTAQLWAAPLEEQSSVSLFEAPAGLLQMPLHVVSSC